MLEPSPLGPAEDSCCWRAFSSVAAQILEVSNFRLKSSLAQYCQPRYWRGCADWPHTGWMFWLWYATPNDKSSGVESSPWSSLDGRIGPFGQNSTTIVAVCLSRFSAAEASLWCQIITMIIYIERAIALFPPIGDCSAAARLPEVWSVTSLDEIVIPWTHENSDDSPRDIVVLGQRLDSPTTFLALDIRPAHGWRRWNITLRDRRLGHGEKHSGQSPFCFFVILILILIILGEYKEGHQNYICMYMTGPSFQISNSKHGSRNDEWWWWFEMIKQHSNKAERHWWMDQGYHKSGRQGPRSKGNLLSLYQNHHFDQFNQFDPHPRFQVLYCIVH